MPAANTGGFEDGGRGFCGHIKRMGRRTKKEPLAKTVRKNVRRGAKSAVKSAKSAVKPVCGFRAE